MKSAGIDALLLQFLFSTSSYRLDSITKNPSRLDWELNLGLSRNRREQVPLYYLIN